MKNYTRFCLRATQSVCLVALLTVGGAIATEARADEIVITIDRVEALDKDDALSRPDFLARVTIAGQIFTTPVVFNQNTITPNWVIRKTVSPGRHSIKVEILDKDVTKNDLIDINRINDKRDLDFTINTRSCQISGFSSGFSCGDKIVRAGAERKKAEITFRVSSTR